MSITIEVSQRGLDLSRLSQMTKEAELKLVAKAADFLLREVQSSVPYKTGALRQSFFKNVAGEKASISSHSPVAVFIEFGTRPHMIYPARARALAFIAGAIGAGTQKIGGGLIFTAYVRHPGTRPQPYAAESMRAMILELPNLWKEVFEEAIK
jgi:hypothetical protein